MDTPQWNANMRQTRIQEALDYRRSRSSLIPMSNGLSPEEEDELEGRAGDTGPGQSWTAGSRGDGDFPSSEFSINTNSAGFPGSVEGHFPPLSPLGVTFVPTSIAPAPPPPAVEKSSEHLPCYLESISVLAHLTTFGIIGVIIRYLLEVLFGPSVAKLTSARSALFIDLPANMLGSFFMGWVGVVFKKDIAMFSEHLAVGLSTGLMGSITTFAAMMQQNLTVMVTDSWITSLFGLLIGVYLAQMSLVVGEDSALILRRGLKLVPAWRDPNGDKKWERPSPENLKRRKMGLALFLPLGGGLWAASAVLAMVDTSSTARRTLWLACCLAPPGVWTRWYWARLNGQGIGFNHSMRWFPVGTFLVNVVAASLDAGLATVGNAVRNQTIKLVLGGISLGTLGCLSTVSTLAVEIQVMYGGDIRWRCYAYPILSMAISLFIGLLVYGVPALVKVVPVF